MRVLNHHSRRLKHSNAAVGERLDTLSGREDRLWPHERWPRMVFDRSLVVGATGGHGPIRYLVEGYDPGREVVFRFTAPKGFFGTHSFRVEAVEGGCELHHTIDMKVSGPALLSWPLIFRPLHDALLEDALDKVEASLGESRWSMRDLPPFVRFLRRILARKRRKTE